MRTHRERRRAVRAFTPRLSIALGSAAGLLVTLSACSSSSTTGTQSGDSGTVSGAQSSAAASCSPPAETFLKNYIKPPTSLPAELAQLSKAPKADGTIVRMYNSKSSSDVEVQKAVEAAASAAGWKASGLSYDGSIADLQAKLTQVVAMKPTAIMSPAGIEPALIKSSIDAAKAAGILVAIGYITTPPTSVPGFGATSVTPATQRTVGKVAADWVVVDSNCKADVVVYNVAGYPAAKISADAFETELKASCPSCTVSYHELPITSFGTPALTQTITSTLQAKSSTNYLFLTLGNFNDGLPAALRQAGLSKVKIVGLVPDTSGIQGLVQKTNAMWVDNSTTMLGWIQVDSVLRALDTNAATSDDVLPGVFTLTQDNINGASEAPTFPADYESQFKKLWKVA